VLGDERAEVPKLHDVCLNQSRVNISSMTA
jgi:hypothetical protein